MTVLVTPDGLAAELDSPDRPLLLDVRWNLGSATGRDEYLSGHLPGAVWVDLDAGLAAPPGDGGRHPLPDPAAFQAAMRRVLPGDAVGRNRCKRPGFWPTKGGLSGRS